MLEVKNLHAAVDGKEILKGLDLFMGLGEVHAIMGPNGSGKSTLSYVLAGRDGYEVTAGSVTYMGQDLLSLIDGLLKFDLRGRTIGVPKEGTLKAPQLPHIDELREDLGVVGKLRVRACQRRRLPPRR